MATLKSEVMYRCSISRRCSSRRGRPWREHALHARPLHLTKTASLWLVDLTKRIDWARRRSSALRVSGLWMGLDGDPRRRRDRDMPLTTRSLRRLSISPTGKLPSLSNKAHLRWKTACHGLPSEHAYCHLIKHGLTPLHVVNTTWTYPLSSCWRSSIYSAKWCR